ncbi:MAG TPA: InlB B-repeat-containing protein, partial [Tenuifilaceae bacterium]|nr:InlB B-repeat-containing protein [Tenuifilaceae bacterium]
METLPYDGIHHIDMHIKLLDEETLLVGQYPEGVADGPQIEENLNYILNNFQTPYGRPYRVFRIPMPPDESGDYPDDYSDYLTYTNSVILNGLVLVPIYNLPQDDEALDVYREAMPGYEVVGINMRNVIPASGAIHCITKEIAAEDPIFIDHAPIRDEVSYSSTGYEVEAEISSYSGINDASVFWSIDTESGFNEIDMTLDGDVYSATIPAQSTNTTVYYYISATNGNTKTLTKPLVAPEGAYIFTIEGGTVEQHTLTLNIVGSGQVSVNGTNYSSPMQIDENSTVNLTANPNTGNHFVSWSGGISSTNPTESFSMVSDFTITATFEINTYTLTYSAGTNGSLSGETSQNVNHGENGTTITAIPNTGYHFVQWSDGVTSNPRTDNNVTGNINVTAQFAINTYTVQYSADAGGSISGNTSQTINYGANGTAVTAVPNTGYYFTQWSDGNTDNPRTDNNVTENISVSAEFETYTFNLTYSAGVNGSLTGETSQTVDYGTNGSPVSAIPNIGYHFKDWSDGNSSNPRTDENVTDDIDVTANFEINSYTLSYSANENGSITGETTQTVNHGENGTEVTAMPITGYHFTQWSDGSTENPRTDVNVTDNISVTAEFEINRYSLTIAKVGNGTVSPVAGDYEYVHGTIINLFASPDLGYDFEKWTVGSTEYFTRNAQFTLTEDVTVTAHFIETIENQYEISISIEGSGTTMPPVGTHYYVEGSTVSLEATPSFHWHFDGWSGDFSSEQANASFTINENSNVVATFVIDSYTLSYAAGENGAISGETSQTVNHGASGSEVTAVPNTGYHFTQWSDGSTANPRTDSNVTENISVTAEFVLNSYTLNYVAGENGAISGEASQTVNHGASGSEVTAVPNTGYHFTQWSDGSTANPRTDSNVT